MKRLPKYLCAFIMTIGLLPMWIMWAIFDTALGWNMLPDIMRKMWTYE